VSVTAVVTLTSGQSFELKPWHVDVHQTLVRHGPDAARLALVRDRTASQLAALARGMPAQEPRVLVATADLGLGGGQLYLHELMLRLARNGVRFALTSPCSTAARPCWPTSSPPSPVLTPGFAWGCR
jgi:hypothetical protein